MKTSYFVVVLYITVIIMLATIQHQSANVRRLNEAGDHMVGNMEKMAELMTEFHGEELDDIAIMDEAEIRDTTPDLQAIADKGSWEFPERPREHYLFGIADPCDIQRTTFWLWDEDDSELGIRGYDVAIEQVAAALPDAVLVTEPSGRKVLLHRGQVDGGWPISTQVGWEGDNIPPINWLYVPGLKKWFPPSGQIAFTESEDEVVAMLEPEKQEDER